jgi:hypothetical protein
MKTELAPARTGRLCGAYGSNLHIAQMRERCPDAIRVCSGWLDDFRLVFRTVADVEPCPGSRVPIGLWLVSAADERALDRYEGVRSGVYERVFLPVRTANGIEEALIYRMLSTGYAAPPRSYLERILSGYAAWGFDVAVLNAAVEASAARFG